MDHPTLHVLQYDRVVRITLNRPEVRNAQSRVMLEELDAVLQEAAGNDSVRVIIIAGAGDHFCAGHDLGSPEEKADAARRAPASWEERYLLWRELFLDSTLRWRNLPKPTIAQVQGYCIMGGVMLALACDFIICADDARFACRAVRWGASSEQYLALPWAIGVPQAKQYLFTGDDISAEVALRLGLVNEMVPRAELESYTMRLAQRIALQEPFALRMAKEACNAVLDIQGQRSHLHHAFLSWAVSGTRPAVAERMETEEGLPVTEQIRRRDEKYAS